MATSVYGSHTLHKEQKLQCRITRINIAFTLIALPSDASWISGTCKSVCLNHVGVPTTKRLDQGHLHPKLEVPGTDISWPGIEPRPPPRWEASTLEKSISNSLYCSYYYLYMAAPAYNTHTLRNERKLKYRITRISIAITRITLTSDTPWISGTCMSVCLNQVTTIKRPS